MSVPNTMSDSRDNTQDLAARARALLRRATQRYDEKYGCGMMSCAPYDTAWVSMITKEVDGQRGWLFPECFEYLLQKQNEDGSWGAESESQIDGILNTGAPLLSLLRHRLQPLQTPYDDSALAGRIANAISSLRSQLSAWNVSTTAHVGFEIIVPAILRYLEETDETLRFEFPGREELMQINSQKMRRFKPEYLYGHVQMTALHSLESFIGQVDFDKVAHHKRNGSMMASPSSTAAYLMHSSKWDDEAEHYLRHVINAYQEGGGVPSAYPSTYFEYTWIISTLLLGGFQRSELETPELNQMADVLESAFQSEGGVIGFAPFVGSDVDDTAKGILTLDLLGRTISPGPMIATFEAEKGFRTYPSERDPSFSANCNALVTLLCQRDPRIFASQISKTVKFLCDIWWDTDGVITDKWNTDHLYPSLLVVKAFTRLFELVHRGGLEDVLDFEQLQRAYIVFFQACLRALLGQQENGSWSDRVESTAYAVNILCSAMKSDLFETLRVEVGEAIKRGVQFLQDGNASTVQFCWIEKVSYASPLLTESYVLAALKEASRLHSQGHHPVAPPKADATAVAFFRQTPLFSSIPRHEIQASYIEAKLFQPLLRRRRLLVFPRKDMEEDKYFDLIPFTWTACNNRKRVFSSTTYLFEMMIISFLNYQADEFMEAVAGQEYSDDLEALHRLIDDIVLGNSKGGKNGHVATNGEAKSPPHFKQTTTTNEAAGPLTKFVDYVLQHPSVERASSWSRKVLREELGVFLHAHVHQTADNMRFAQDARRQSSPSSTSVTYTSTSSSFLRWVRSTSADHTSCPYAFAFVCCLLSSRDGRDAFESAAEKYIAADVCRHLATMCRMYNDYGSIARDAAEENLNSINFPEFSSQEEEEAKRTALFELAEYERRCLDDSLARLEEQSKREALAKRRTPDEQRLCARRMHIWRMFCDVTDLYGQLYVVRDMASRMVRKDGK
ncbi:Copalyl diphosphate synthase [Xylariaceae sp. FL0594]|nr:Copalyl diphosphate synthase [Xylariaceae sp. FL0594]